MPRDGPRLVRLPLPRRRPTAGILPAAIGLAGKVLGPAGLALAVRQRRWPARVFTISVGSDLTWWLPFTLYLHDAATDPAPGSAPRSGLAANDGAA